MNDVAGELLAKLAAAFDDVLAADLSAMSGVEVVEFMAGFETQMRRSGAVGARLVHEVDEHRLYGDYGRTSTADLLRELLRIDPGEARARCQRADDTAPRRELTGTPLPPMFPRVAEAQAAGTISPAHVSVILRAMREIPRGAPTEAWTVAENYLVDVAEQLSPHATAVEANKLIDALDPDGPCPSEEELARRRGLTLSELRDGTVQLRGRLDPETGAVWRTILDALSKPAPCDATGERDLRSAEQRRHDGLRDAGLRLLRSGSLPRSGGSPVTVLVRTTDETMVRGQGHAVTDHGGLLSMTTVMRLAGDGQVQTFSVDADGALLRAGRAQRLASCAQRRALALRDGGCSFPGCTRPAAWCEAHHVVPWSEGGPTDVENTCLLCAYHHREFEHRGWTVFMRDGLPYWIPPRWLDAEQRPIRNIAHHDPDIDLGALGVHPPPGLHDQLAGVGPPNTG